MLPPDGNMSCSASTQLCQGSFDSTRYSTLALELCSLPGHPMTHAACTSVKPSASLHMFPRETCCKLMTGKSLLTARIDFMSGRTSITSESAGMGLMYTVRSGCNRRQVLTDHEKRSLKRGWRNWERNLSERLDKQKACLSRRVRNADLSQAKCGVPLPLSRRLVGRDNEVARDRRRRGFAWGCRGFTYRLERGGKRESHWGR